MKHPFLGIMPSVPPESTRSMQPDRREAIAVIAATLGSATVGSLATAAEPNDEKAPSPTHALYFVVPKELKSLGPKERAKLGIDGPYKGRWPDEHRFQDKRGYLAWLTADASAALKKMPAIADVSKFTAGDVVVYGEPKKLSNQLTIYLSPNSWGEKTDESTYQSAKSLAKKWSDDFAKEKSLNITADKEGKHIQISIAGGKPNPEVITAIRESGQVHQITWATEVTTLAIGEEGGAKPTTLAIGEEGGPSTRRLGEEGGVTTKALGEEGGPTTEAPREEGGIRPTTLAVGEEGGATTEALGEEGGIAPSVLEKEGGRATTLAIGEEGGAKPRLDIK